MGRGSIIISEENPVYTESGVQLKETTVLFGTDQYKEAIDHASRKRSYVGVAYNIRGEIVGYYIPA